MNSSKKNRESPRVVAFGGGTGMYSLLSGLRAYTPHITAVVTVTDDGGSSGILRKDFDIPPPGDIRSCLLALSDAEPLLKEALKWRFSEGQLNGHSLGNLLIAAATLLKGDFAAAVRELHPILRVRGRVLPSCPAKVGLLAYHADGSSSTGEVRINRAPVPIKRVELRPRPPRVSKEILQAVEEADFLVFGPGSLFTSVIPNLLIPGLGEAVRASGKPAVYVANIMTEAAETDGYTLSAHVEAFERHSGKGLLTAIVASSTPIPDPLLEKYRREGAEPVVLDRKKVNGLPVYKADLAISDRFMRHSPERLAGFLLNDFWRTEL